MKMDEYEDNSDDFEDDDFGDVDEHESNANAQKRSTR